MVDGSWTLLWGNAHLAPAAAAAASAAARMGVGPGNPSSSNNRERGLTRSKTRRNLAAVLASAWRLLGNSGSPDAAIPNVQVACPWLARWRGTNAREMGGVAPKPGILPEPGGPLVPVRVSECVKEVHEVGCCLWGVEIVLGKAI